MGVGCITFEQAPVGISQKQVLFILLQLSTLFWPKQPNRQGLYAQNVD